MQAIPCHATMQNLTKNITSRANGTFVMHYNAVNGSCNQMTGPPTPGVDFLVSTSIIALLILVGNIMVILVFKADRRLRRMTNKFVISLAVSDTLVAAVYIPVYLNDALKGQQTIVQYIVCFIWFASILNHCGLAYDRYQGVTKPLHYEQIMTPRKVKTLLVMIWVIPMINTAIPMPFVLNPTLHPMRKKMIVEYFILADLAFIFICTILIFSSYMVLFKIARRHVLEITRISARPSRRDSPGETESLQPIETRSGFKAHRISFDSLKVELKAARLFALIVLTHFICWCPMVYDNLCFIFIPPNRMDLIEMLIPVEVRFIVYYAFILNSCINPIIYGLLRKEFREGLRKLFNYRRVNGPLKKKEKVSLKILQNPETEDAFTEI
uniref:Biogenic amine-like GPCR n=1 Tax=Tripedalia cystophora TaxID=6141 RepID=A0A4D5XW87_TRICY|nr:biogenic amine-like GPCR [Tripedalia cystophora]